MRQEIMTEVTSCLKNAPIAFKFIGAKKYGRAFERFASKLCDAVSEKAADHAGPTDGSKMPSSATKSG